MVTLRHLKTGDYFNLLHPAVNEHQYVIYYGKKVRDFQIFSSLGYKENARCRKRHMNTTGP